MGHEREGGAGFRRLVQPLFSSSFAIFWQPAEREDLNQFSSLLVAVGGIPNVAIGDVHLQYVCNCLPQGALPATVQPPPPPSLSTTSLQPKDNPGVGQGRHCNHTSSPKDFPWYFDDGIHLLLYLKS